MKMTSHKAKCVWSLCSVQYKYSQGVSRSFFKKWLELERRLGDEEGAEAVKAKAIEWTQRANSA